MGAALGAGFTPTIVMVQRLLPGRMGAASGIVLGLSFGAGAVGQLRHRDSRRRGGLEHRLRRNCAGAAHDPGGAALDAAPRAAAFLAAGGKHLTKS